jgi:spore photoproduct lyase
LLTETKSRIWLPDRVLVTPSATREEWGQQILRRVEALNIPIIELSSDRLTGIRGEDERETYSIAKRTMAIVTAPPSDLKLSPIPPSADWQFHLARGCPAHCQYCYLAGSLQGPPVIRVYANLPSILDNLANYEKPNNVSSFEVSCYTDPLSLEHLTGSLSECIRYFGTRPNARLRWVSKFANVDSLLDLPHNGRTRCRVSINAIPIARQLEGGTATVKERLEALGKLSTAGYPIGLVIAPIMAIEDWRDHYEALFQEIRDNIDLSADLTFELISHRFTPGSKEVLQTWYPNGKLDMSEDDRRAKRNKFGGLKYVYTDGTMKELRGFFTDRIDRFFPRAELLYWT